MFISESNSRQEVPMLIAVSTLSPVSTHTWIPADFKSWMVLPTSSYSLSSIAEDPINSKSCSRSSATLFISFSRLTDVAATEYFWAQSQ